MDETLGHFMNGQYFPRPGVDEFLKKLNESFELVLFTSALENYANCAMCVIDKMEFIKLRLYRQHLKMINGKPAKDLSILGRDLEKVIIIDNDPSNFRLQPGNGVFIKSWTGQQDDEELEKFKEILSSVESSESITLKEVVDKLNSR